jgi:hypothetical protein
LTTSIVSPLCSATPALSGPRLDMETSIGTNSSPRRGFCSSKRRGGVGGDPAQQLVEDSSHVIGSSQLKSRPRAASLLTRPRSATSSGTPLDAANVRRGFRRIATAAGLNAKDWTPRELRHSFVSLLSDEGVPIERIARPVGHAGGSAVVYRSVYACGVTPLTAAGPSLASVDCGNHHIPRDEHCVVCQRVDHPARRHTIRYGNPEKPIMPLGARRKSAGHSRDEVSGTHSLDHG